MARIYTDEDSEARLDLVILKFITEKMTPNASILSLLSVIIRVIRGQNPLLSDPFSLV